MKQVTVKHSFAGKLVVLLLSRLLRGMYLYVRAMNLRLLSALRLPSPKNPPLLRIGSLYNARNCLAYTHPHAYLPIRPPTLLLLWALLAAAA